MIDYVALDAFRKQQGGPMKYARELGITDVSDAAGARRALVQAGTFFAGDNNPNLFLWGIGDVIAGLEAQLDQLENEILRCECFHLDLMPQLQNRRHRILAMLQLFYGRRVLIGLELIESATFVEGPAAP
jgi:hypothetical protein